MRAALCLALGLALASCSGRIPPEYARAQAAAQRATTSGRYREAADHWLRAADLAPDLRHGQEAQYRAAANLERAGEPQRAIQVYQKIAQGPTSDRSARTAFALAELEFKLGHRERGDRLLEQALTAHPNAGVAQRALRRQVLRLEQETQAGALRLYLEDHLARFQDTELDPHLRYELARHLERSGELAAARTAYVDLATRYPYPHGVLWDDALMRAAELEGKLGHWTQAVSLLERLVKAREKSPRRMGSYERPSFAASRFRIAEIYANHLARPDLAEAAFLQVFNDYPTSRLRDDALWRALELARSRGDVTAACKAKQLLRTHFSQSRYANLGALACPPH